MAFSALIKTLTTEFSLSSVSYLSFRLFLLLSLFRKLHIRMCILTRCILRLLCQCHLLPAKIWTNNSKTNSNSLFSWLPFLPLSHSSLRVTSSQLLLCVLCSGNRRWRWKILASRLQFACNIYLITGCYLHGISSQNLILFTQCKPSNCRKPTEASSNNYSMEFILLLYWMFPFEMLINQLITLAFCACFFHHSFVRCTNKERSGKLFMA